MVYPAWWPFIIIFWWKTNHFHTVDTLFIRANLVTTDIPWEEWRVFMHATWAALRLSSYTTKCWMVVHIRALCSNWRHSTKRFWRTLVSKQLWPLSWLHCIDIKKTMFARVLWVDAYWQMSPLPSLCDILVSRYGLGLSFNASVWNVHLLARKNISHKF